MSPGQVEAQDSGRGEQLWEAMITVTTGMPWTSSAHKGPQVTVQLEGQPGGRSIPRTVSVRHLFLQWLEGCLCCLPPFPALALDVPQPLVAAYLLVAVVSGGHFPACGSGFGGSLLLAKGTEGPP